jgi:hypothetical protein
VLYPPSLTLIVFLKRIQCSFHSLESGYFAQRWCPSHFKTLWDKQYSCYIVTEFSLLNKVLNSPPPNSNGSLTRDKVLLPFTWKSYLTQRYSHFRPLKTVSIPLKVYSILSAEESPTASFW